MVDNVRGDINNEYKAFRKQKKTINRNNQKDIQRLQELQTKRKADLYALHQEKLGQIKNDQQTKELEAIESNKNKIEKIKTRNDGLEKFLANEKEQLVLKHDQQLGNINNDFLVKVDNDLQKNKMLTQEMTNNNQIRLDQLKTKVHNEQLLQNFKASQDIDRITTNTDEKIFEERVRSKNQIQRNQSKFADEIMTQEREQNLIKNEKRKEYENFLKMQTLRYQGQIDSEKKLYEQQLQQQKESYKAKFNVLTNEQKSQIESLNSNVKRVVDNIKRNNRSEYKFYNDRQDDLFYANVTLNPQISETEKEYILKIKTPEHESENYMLSGHGRTLKLTFQRRMVNELRDGIQGVSKTRRSELQVREIPVTAIIDDTKIQRQYENDILSFKIAKA